MSVTAEDSVLIAEPSVPSEKEDDGFSEMMARWLDDGDRLDDDDDGGAPAVALPAAGRWARLRAGARAHTLAFLGRFRSETFRYRALIAGAAIVSLLLVVVLRHQAGAARIAVGAPAAPPPVTQPAPATEPAPAPPVAVAAARENRRSAARHAAKRARAKKARKRSAATAVARGPRGTSRAGAHPAPGSSRIARTSDTAARR